jgi:hypothetical protein
MRADRDGMAGGLRIVEYADGLTWWTYVVD